MTEHPGTPVWPAEVCRDCGAEMFKCFAMVTAVGEDAKHPRGYAYCYPCKARRERAGLLFSDAPVEQVQAALEAA